MPGPDLWPVCDEKREPHRELNPGPLTHEARTLCTKPWALHLYMQKGGRWSSQHVKLRTYLVEGLYAILCVRLSYCLDCIPFLNNNYTMKMLYRDVVWLWVCGMDAVSCDHIKYSRRVRIGVIGWQGSRPLIPV